MISNSINLYNDFYFVSILVQSDLKLSYNYYWAKSVNTERIKCHDTDTRGGTKLLSLTLPKIYPVKIIESPPIPNKCPLKITIKCKN